MFEGMWASLMVEDGLAGCGLEVWSGGAVWGVTRLSQHEIARIYKCPFIIATNPATTTLMTGLNFLDWAHII